jgi:hypothetical protein
MGKQTINVGVTANDGTGSTIRAGGQIVNSNTTEIYDALGDGSTLAFDLNTQSPSDGQALIYNAASGKWRPGTATSVSTFIVAGDSGSNQTITTGTDTLTIQGNTGIHTEGVNTDIISVSIDNTVVATLTGTQTLTNKTINASQLVNSSVSNAKLANSSISVVDDSSTSSTISLGETLKISGGTGLSSSISGDTVTVNLDNTGVSATSYGSSTAIPVITVNAQGQLTNVTTAAVSSDLTIVDDSSTSTIITLGTDTLKVAGGTGISTAISGDTLTVTNTGISLTYTNGTATGDGSTQTFTIDSGRAVNDILVSVNGFILTPTTDYTVSGTNLNFVTAPAASAEINIRYLPLTGSATYTNGEFTGDGSTQGFTIDSGRSVEDVLVTVNGVVLVPSTDYSISGTTLTFTTAPAASAEISVRYLRLT